MVLDGRKLHPLPLGTQMAAGLQVSKVQVSGSMVDVPSPALLSQTNNVPTDCSRNNKFG